MAEDDSSLGDSSLEKSSENRGQRASRARTIPPKLRDSSFELKENDPNGKFLYRA